VSIPGCQLHALPRAPFTCAKHPWVKLYCQWHLCNFSGCASCPCLIALSLHGIKKKKFPCGKLTQQLGGEQLMGSQFPSRIPSPKRLKRRNKGAFFNLYDFFEAVTCFAEYPFIVAVRCWSEGALLVAVDEQDGPVSLRAPGPACLKQPTLGLSKPRLLQACGLCSLCGGRS